MGSLAGNTPDLGGPESGLASDGAPSLDLVALLCAFGKTLLFLLPVYLVGYLGLSVCLVVFGLLVYMGWQATREGKAKRLLSALDVLQNEEAVTTKSIYLSKKELPAWITFSDVEKVEWLNKIITQMWPFIGKYLEKLLMETIAPTIRASNNHLQTFFFTKVQLGEKPLKVVGVKAHTEMDKRQIILDLHLSFVGDTEINVEIKRYFCKAGVKGIQLHGMLRVILEPLIGDMPLVGAVTIFFIRRPVLDINWTGVTNLLDIPGLNAFTDTKIMDTIAAFLVLPNRLTIPLVENLHVSQLRSPLPRGIIRIYLIEAENLESKDSYGIFKGKSDPYAILRVGTQTFTSKTIEESLNPKWNELYEIFVHEVPGQELEIEIFDKDPDSDDFLGRMKLDLGEVLKACFLDKWFFLKEVGTGRVHLRLEWLSLMTNTSKLDQILQDNQVIFSQTKKEPSAAILAVYLDRAQDLPLKKGNKEPNPMVQLAVKEKPRESKTCYNTNSPVWEDAYFFYIQNPKTQELKIQVKDDDRQTSLGSLTLPLCRLLNSEDLTLDQWFQLDQSGSGSRIYLKVVLRVLFLECADSSLALNPLTVPDDETPRKPKSGTEKDQDKQTKCAEAVAMLPPKPTKSSADKCFGREGVVRIYLKEAENLIAKDNFMKGLVKGKSDPYAVVKLTGKSFRSKVIKENLNPQWNEIYEFIVNDIPGQEVEFQLFDKDVDKDDFLGRCKISLTHIISSKTIDKWYPLEDVKSGRLHIRLEWLPPTPSATDLEEVLLVNTVTPVQNSEELSAAILAIYLDRAQELPLKKGNKSPSPSAEISVRDVSYKTKTCSQTNSPIWEEAFNFLIKNPTQEKLEILIKDNGRNTLGSLSLPLAPLLTADDLTMDQWFTMDNSGPSSQVLLKLQLGILVPQPPAVTPSAASTISAESPEQANAEMKDSNSRVLDTESSESEHSVLIPSSSSNTSMQELRQRLSHTQSKSDLCDSPFGQIRLTVSHSSEEKKLYIVVHSCRKLKACSKDGSSPYVSLILLPDKNRVTKKKTPVVKSLNPEYNLQFDYDMDLGTAQKRKLEVSVKNSVSFMSRDKELIGKVHIDLSLVDLSQGITQWFDLNEG
ncbi:extended synaptotagmin-1 [Latimeria chalumnae]|uniref:extended synaptotagmin-1 n=1 Tax=Latimeria chalumnae TaxID=7897 RepID=UPI0006D8E7F0|nr:PREDICTED: extended synaptotagmin-1 [Latimeria chalumnae]|eukprot:XP_014341295.1 PREDICTED: extended synaptotagmin-1 [Latimeria chalumnae]